MLSQFLQFMFSGVTARIDVLPTDSIERTVVGKAKRVIDKRPK